MVLTYATGRKCAPSCIFVEWMHHFRDEHRASLDDYRHGQKMALSNEHLMLLLWIGLSLNSPHDYFFGLRTPLSLQSYVRQNFLWNMMPFFTDKGMNEGTPDPIPADRNGGVWKVKATVAFQKQQSMPNFLYGLSTGSSTLCHVLFVSCLWIKSKESSFQIEIRWAYKTSRIHATDPCHWQTENIWLFVKIGSWNCACTAKECCVWY